MSQIFSHSMVFIFSTSQLLASLFLILCLLLVYWFLLLFIYLEAFSIDFIFCLVFHYNASNLEASCDGSSQVFDHCNQSKQHRPKVVGVRNLMDLIVGRLLAVWTEHKTCGCLVVWCLVVVAFCCWWESPNIVLVLSMTLEFVWKSFIE